jgi:predicted DNA-binding transcriptional regulator AlpA
MAELSKTEAASANAATGIAKAALSVPEFCGAYGISPTLYQTMKANHIGPREFRIGRRILISVDAAREWVAEREAASAGKKR